MILGCDGIWETLTNEEIIKFVRKRINKQDMRKTVEELLDKLLAPDTSTGLGCDNMTCIIVNLNNFKKSK